MPDSADLLVTARFLIVAPPQPPSDARLRRAASTAYYAVFHHIARRAAMTFMASASKEAGGRSLIYRSFDHGLMKQVCTALARPELAAPVARSLGRTAVSTDVKDFASLFGALQQQRHRADYDPLAVFRLWDVGALVQNATEAIAAFDRAAPDEQADVLALIMVRPRP